MILFTSSVTSHFHTAYPSAGGFPLPEHPGAGGSLRREELRLRASGVWIPVRERRLRRRSGEDRQDMGWADARDAAPTKTWNSPAVG